MYLPEREEVLDALTRRVAAGGCLSITFRNAHVLAMRPGLRGDWAQAFRSFEGRDYVNELGVAAVADRLDDIELYLETIGFTSVAWYGVRVFNDAAPADAPVPDGPELTQLLDAEELASRRDPYRSIGSQIHLVSARTP